VIERTVSFAECAKIGEKENDNPCSRIEIGETPSDVLNDLGVNRYCCRRMLLSHIEILNDVLKFHEDREIPDLRGGK
jgi:DNA-directed RNA polymerase subunit N (RpoN/RPB10)